MTARLEDWLSQLAGRRPETRSVVVHGECVTAGELEVRANRFARRLAAAGCVAGDRVALLLPNSIPAVVAVLGCLKADLICVPLDTKNPSSRLGKVLRNAMPRVLVSVAELASKVDACPPLITMDSDAPEEESHPLIQERSCQAAFLLYTSGSTGDPKGVVVTHSAVRQFVQWAVRHFGIDASDRMSGHPPLHFDLAMFDLFGSLAAGAELHIVPPHQVLLPHRLADFIRAARLTQWFSVPSVLSYLARHNAVGQEHFGSLRRVLWCGEALPTPTLRHWMSRLPQASFTNLYGPTETTIASTYYTVPACPEDDGIAIPIGSACAGEQVLVLDPHLRPVQPGDLGEIYIAGVGLSPGYWNDQRSTAAVFLDGRPGLPPRMYRTGDLARLGVNGAIYFAGRRDSQIKSRGYRIELGEVEAALHGLGLVSAAAVVAVPTGGFDGYAICCAYVNAQPISPPLLRRALAQQLPPYMLPTRWLSLDRLPTSSTGKVDRRQLQECFSRDLASRSR